MNRVRWLFGGAGLFFVIGAAQAMYGPLFPQIRAEFGLDETAVGTLVGAHFAGALVAILTWSVAEARGLAPWGYATCSAALAAGAAMLATSPSWNLLLAGAAVLGLGYGGVVLGVNRLLATAYSERASGPLNLVNAAFGVSAIVGPLAVSAIPKTEGRLLYAGISLLALIAVPLMGVPRIINRAAPGRSPSSGDGADTSAEPRDRPWLVAGFALLFLLYVSVEAGASAWAASHLIAQGSTQSEGAVVTAAFWGGLALGRILAAPLSTRLVPSSLVALALILATLAAAATAIPGLQALAYVLTGFALAPIFPTAFAWLTVLFPRSSGVGALAVGAGSIGGALGPRLLGVVTEAASIRDVPFVLAGLAAACLGCALLLRRYARV